MRVRDGDVTEWSASLYTPSSAWCEGWVYGYCSSLVIGRDVSGKG